MSNSHCHDRSYAAWDDAPRQSAAHAGCGEPAHVQIRCAAGHPVPEDELAVRGSTGPDIDLH